MFRILLFTVALAMVISSNAMAGTIALVSGDLSWTGAPTSDGDASWPAVLNMEFDEPHKIVQASLTSSEYSGDWTLTHTFTFSNTLFFTDTFNNEATIGLSMDPLAPLTEATFADVTKARFEWAHPDFNDPDEDVPVSWLFLEGVPEAVPEASSLALLSLGMLGLSIRRRR